jgi:L-fucose isomerase-like protein
MHALKLAAGAPSALADINNVHNEDPDLVNVWHCGVFPTSYAKEKPRVGAHFLMGQTLGPEKASGVVEFRVKEGPLTLSRITEDGDGRWKAFICEGAVEDNPAATSGSYGWCRIPGFQRIYSQTLLRHFPHHTAIVPGHLGNVLYEALGAYLGMEVYVPQQPLPGRYVPGNPFG